MFDQFVDLLFNLIFQPGSSLQLIPYINLTVLLLMGLLLVCGLYLDIPRIHLYVLTFFATGLFFSVNWFLYEFNKVKSQQDAIDSDPSKSKEGGKKTKTISQPVPASSLKED